MAVVYHPNLTDKPWGHTRALEIGDHHEIHHATIKKGGYSSRHYHKHKSNTFYVVSGHLLVQIFDEGRLAPIDKHVLSAGMSLTVAHGVWHRFEALTDVELIETYHVWPIAQFDIVRADTGGLKP